MADADVSAKELAAKLDMDPRTITRWRRGVVRPDGDSRAALDALSGGAVPASCWARITASARAA
jgi:ribosome-binding protein aMBF1 (putative translation factor)